MAIAEVCGTKYHVDNKLKKRWDTINNGQLAKLDEDRVYVVVGREGFGKSLFSIQQAAYIDPTIISESLAKKKLCRITFSPEDTLKEIRDHKSTLKITRPIIFDEAFRGLSSRSVLSKTNKMIVQALMEMRQKNLVLFIVLPSFHLLDRYPAVFRSSALFQILKEKNARRRTFRVYNYSKKAALYNFGLKNAWKARVFTNFRGRFFNKYPGGDEFEALYRKEKHDALIKLGGMQVDPHMEETKVMIQRDCLALELIDVHKYTAQRVSDIYKKFKVDATPSAVTKGVAKRRNDSKKEPKSEE